MFKTINNAQLHETVFLISTTFYNISKAPIYMFVWFCILQNVLHKNIMNLGVKREEKGFFCAKETSLFSNSIIYAVLTVAVNCGNCISKD